MKFYKSEKLHSEENLIAYVRHSFGAIELHEDYVVFYANLLPFEWAVLGRMSFVVNLDTISLLGYRRPGLFTGLYFLGHKGHSKPSKIYIYRIMFWKNKELRLKLEPIYEFIYNKVQIAWKKEYYRKVQTVEEIKKMGHCPICGEYVEKETVFCSKCGTKIGGQNE